MLAFFPRNSWLLALLLLAFLPGCGSKKNSANVGPVAKVQLAPADVSLNAGDVLQMQVLATDANNRGVFNQTFTFASSNPAIQIAHNGMLCAGTWDSLTAPIVCTAGAPGKSNVTAVVQGVTSNVVVASVHLPVTSLTVVVSSNAATCSITPPGMAGFLGVSQGKTMQFSPIAKNNATDITSTVGSIHWTISNPAVGTLAAATTSAAAANTVTAKLPGRADVIASVNSTNAVNSVAVEFAECPVASIAITPNPVFATPAAVGATKQLAAVVTDTLGVAVKSAPLTWNSTLAAVAGVGPTGIATAVAAGSAGIVAACTSATTTNCNIGLNQPVYSNLATATVKGASSTTVYVTGAAATKLIPIATSTNTAGTAITLTAKPNSLVFNTAGTRAYLGSASGLMVLDPAANTVTAPNSGIPGKVLAVAPNATATTGLLLLSDSTNVFLFDLAANALRTFTIAGATAADFTPDGLRAYVAAPTGVFVVQPSLSQQAVAPAITSASDVSLVASGSAAYAAVAGTPRIATCDNSSASGPGGAPVLVKSLPNGALMLGAESPNLDLIPVAFSGNTCPPTITDSLVQVALLGSAFVPAQIIATPDSNHAYVTSNAMGKLLRCDITAGPPPGCSSATPITLATTTAITFTGGATPDSASVYVGADDGSVHRIDVATGTDAQQLTVPFTPDLVAVRP